MLKQNLYFLIFGVLWLSSVPSGVDSEGILDSKLVDIPPNKKALLRNPDTSNLPLFIKQPADVYYFTETQSKPVKVICVAGGVQQINFKCPERHFSPNDKEVKTEKEKMKVNAKKERTIIKSTLSINPETVMEFFGPFKCECIAWGEDHPDGQNPPKITSKPGFFINQSFIELPFQRQPKSSSFTAGQPFKLDCKVPKGRPEPKISWLKNGDEVIGKYDRSSKFLINNDGSLIKSQADQRDAGNYTCVATNFAGTKSSRPAKVTIKVDGQWSMWSGWTQCLSRCGPGGKSRSRQCINPAPMNGGKRCFGPRIDRKSCLNPIPCPDSELNQVAEWGVWTLYSDCKDCVRRRTRVCVRNPAYPPHLAPSGGGGGGGGNRPSEATTRTRCPGTNQQSIRCDKPECRNKSQWNNGRSAIVRVSAAAAASGSPPSNANANKTSVTTLNAASSTTEGPNKLTNTVEKKSGSGPSENFGLYMAIFVAAAVLLIFIVVLVCFLVKRKLKRHDTEIEMFANDNHHKSKNYRDIIAIQPDITRTMGGGAGGGYSYNTKSRTPKVTDNPLHTQSLHSPAPLTKAFSYDSWNLYVPPPPSLHQQGGTGTVGGGLSPSSAAIATTAFNSSAGPFSGPQIECSETEPFLKAERENAQNELQSRDLRTSRPSGATTPLLTAASSALMARLVEDAKTDSNIFVYGRFTSAGGSLLIPRLGITLTVPQGAVSEHCAEMFYLSVTREDKLRPRIAETQTLLSPIITWGWTGSPGVGDSSGDGDGAGARAVGGVSYINKPLLLSFPHCAKIDEAEAWLLTLLGSASSSPSSSSFSNSSGGASYPNPINNSSPTTDYNIGHPDHWQELVVIGEDDNDSIFCQVDESSCHVMFTDTYRFALIGQSISDSFMAASKPPTPACKLLRLAAFVPQSLSTDINLRVYVIQDTEEALEAVEEEERKLGAVLIESLPRVPFLANGDNLCLKIETPEETRQGGASCSSGGPWRSKVPVQEIPFGHIWSNTQNNIHCSFSLEYIAAASRGGGGDSLLTLEQLTAKVIVKQKRSPHSTLLHLTSSTYTQPKRHSKMSSGAAAVVNGPTSLSVGGPVMGGSGSTSTSSSRDGRNTGPQFQQSTMQHTFSLSPTVRSKICQILDVEDADPNSRCNNTSSINYHLPSPSAAATCSNWRLLANTLFGSDRYNRYFSQTLSPTDALLTLWESRISAQPQIALNELVAIFKFMNRIDLIHIIDEHYS